MTAGDRETADATTAGNRGISRESDQYWPVPRDVSAGAASVGPANDRGALGPLLRLAWRSSGRGWREAALLGAAVAIPVAFGAFLGPVVTVGVGPLAVILLAAMVGVVALSVGAALATSTKRRVLRYGRLTAIGADPTQVRVLLALEALAPTAIGFAIGATVGTAASVAIGPFRWVIDEVASETTGGPDPSTILAVMVGVSLAVLAVVTLLGLWFGAGPAAAMALRAPVEALGARAPEPDPRPGQARLGAALVAGGLGYCLLHVEFAFPLLIVAVAAVFAGLHLLMAPALIRLDRWSPDLPRLLRLAVRNATRNRTRFGHLTLAALATVALGVMASAGLLSDSPDNPASGRHHPMDERFVLVPQLVVGTQAEARIRGAITVEAEAELQLLDSVVAQVQQHTDYVSVRSTVLVRWTRELSRALEAGSGTTSDTIAEAAAAIERGALVVADGTDLPLATEPIEHPVDPDALDVHVARLGFGTNRPASSIGSSTAAVDDPVVLVGAERAEELGAEPRQRFLLLVADRPLSDEQRDQMVGALVGRSPGLPTDGVGGELVVAGFAAAFLVAFGLVGAALSGIETEHEVAAMIANGASPSIRRWFRAVQSALQLGVAGLVGAPLGVLLFWAVTRTDPTVPEPIFPVTTMLILAAGVPLGAAGLVAVFTGSGTPAVSRRVMA